LTFVFAAVAFGQRCDNLTALIEKNSQYGKDGVFNETYFPDAFKDLVTLHIPHVTLDGPRLHVDMNAHPQTADHYITDLWIFDERNYMVGCRKFDSSANVSLDIPISEHTGSLRIFEHCNLHGVWEHPTVEVRCSDLRRLVEENGRLYNKTGIYTKTNFPDAFKDLVGLHVPTVTISDDKKSGTATLSGHPMTEEHHITDIWVVDQHFNQIACDRLHADDKASISFEIPEHVTEIMAIEHCNLHGVWAADRVNMTLLRSL
jgi:desulfoferrodoxin (superoxide reductase-like protein)